MNHLSCPDCKLRIVKPRTKLRLAFLNGSVLCPKCGARLVAGGRFIGVMIGAVVGSMFLYVAFYALAKNSWIPVWVAIIFAWGMAGTATYFAGLRPTGTKRFRI